MKTSYTCAYVHSIKWRACMQRHSGSFISLDGAFGEIMLKGRSRVNEPGGTLKKIEHAALPRRIHNLAGEVERMYWQLTQCKNAGNFSSLRLLFDAAAGARACGALAQGDTHAYRPHGAHTNARDRL